jgi:Leucine-rich repeat (LRR) protein
MVNLSSAGIYPMCKYKYWGNKITCQRNLKKIIRRGIFTEIISNRTALEVLNTDLTHMEGSWFEGKNILETLRINFNRVLRNLNNDSFVYFPSLKNLDISYNQIASLNVLLFHPLTNLNRLKMDHNKLQALEAGLFSRQARLKILSLSYNKLKSLGNEILSPLIMLEELYVNNNRLNTLDSRSFVSLENMKILNLSENYLNMLSVRLFTYQKKLIELHLDKNNISTLSSELFSPTIEMEILSFGGNQIVKITDAVLQPLVRLKRLDVMGCPLECDCSLKNFYQLCVARSIRIHVTCKRGNVDSLVTLQHMTCRSLEKFTVILLVIVGLSIFGMLTTILVGSFSKTGNLFSKRRQRESVHDYDYVEFPLDDKSKNVDDFKRMERKKFRSIIYMVLEAYDYLRPLQGRVFSMGIVNTKPTNPDPVIPETSAPSRPPTSLYDIPM